MAELADLESEVKQVSIDMAMITREQYDSWQLAYDVMYKMLEMGIISQEDVGRVVQLLGRK